MKNNKRPLLYTIVEAIVCFIITIPVTMVIIAIIGFFVFKPLPPSSGPALDLRGFFLVLEIFIPVFIVSVIPIYILIRKIRLSFKKLALLGFWIIAISWIYEYIDTWMMIHH